MKAIKVMEKATITPKTKSNYFDANETVQNRVYKSLKLWSMYVDLEESFGSFKVTNFKSITLSIISILKNTFYFFAIF